MGYDITYHPVSPEQMDIWYVKALADPAHAESIATAAGMEDFYIQKYRDVLKAGRGVETGAGFDASHGFFIAICHGFFARYHYIRGGGLSFLGDAITPYVQPWRDIVPASLITGPVEGRLTQNYMSGVYIPADKVRALKADLEPGGTLSSRAAGNFPGAHMDILLTALSESIEQGTGLLEATEVVEPNPMDLNSSSSYSNLFNCDKTGPLLYEKIARAQIAEIMAQRGPSPEDVDTADIQYVKVQRDGLQDKKPGFFGRLFGKK